jgi:CheY-like chemotaxis protein/GAF domain-containing protein
MTYPDPVMTSTRPRLVVLKGALPMDAGLLQALKAAFEVIEVHSPAAAKKMLDGSVGGLVICAPGEYLNVEGEPLPTAAGTILERIGEGLAVVDAQGSVLWSDARFKMADEQVRSEFVRLLRDAVNAYNQPNVVRADNHRQSKRFTFSVDDSFFELVVSPASFDPNQKDKVNSVVGVVWETTAARQHQRRIEAIERAGAELMRIEAASISRLNMAERLKMLEEKIVRSVREVLHFENFEIRLLDRETGQLELVIAVNISPLKIGEVMYARPEGNGISGFVATTGQSYICPNIQQEPMYREGLDNAASSLTVPLKLHDRIVGVFNVESNKANAFDENDRLFAELFGRYIAAAMNILDLLVIERYTTNEQMAQNVVGELSQPLAELTGQVETLRQISEDDPAVKSAIDRIGATITKLRTTLESCTAGPRTILGAEQELHRHQPDPLLQGKRILVADDEPAIRDTLNALLSQKGCDVTVCKTGAETIVALEAAHAQKRMFDMVLSDIKMPDRNGYEVYRKAKELSPDMPVVLMTGFGYDPHHCIVRASQEGLHSFLFKPFKATQLMDVMNKSLTPKP